MSLRLAVAVEIAGQVIPLPERQPGPSMLATGTMTDYSPPTHTMLLFGVDEQGAFLAESRAGATIDLAVDPATGGTIQDLTSVNLVRLATLTAPGQVVRHPVHLRDGSAATLVLTLQEAQ